MRNIRLIHLLKLLTAFMLLVILGSCSKNEFSISGRLTGAGNRTFTIIYTALSDKHDELVKQRVPCTDDAFTLLCATRYPTIAWVIGADGNLLHAIYAEKGDEILINGTYASPLEWKITGNDATERYSKWTASNVALLTADNPKQVNDAIAKYVHANQDDTASALMLITFYHRNIDENGFDALWQELEISDDDKSRLLHTAMMELGNAESSAAKLPVMPLTLRSRNDSTTTINPTAARATILYFWRRTDGPHHGIMRVLSSQPEDVQVADIFLDPDTIQWRYLTQTDTFSRRNAMWAFGGEMNINLKRLAIPSDPFIIVSNRNGKQLYRGVSPSDASAAAAGAK